MKERFLFCLLFLLICKLSYTQSCMLAQSFGGNGSEYGRSIATDKNGNIYISGYFNSKKIEFGDATLVNSNPSGFTMDMFIVKYDSVGSLIWARSFGGIKDDYVFSMDVDSLGNSYMTGSFDSDSISFQSNYFINKGLSDIFLIKMDENGIVVWAKTIGSIDHDNVTDIKIDHSNNLVICGAFRSDTLRFDQITIPKSSIISGYVAKLDNSGNFIWANGLNGIVRSADVDLNNNVTFGGEFYDDTLRIDQVKLVNHSTANTDVFIAKYNTNGSLIYAKGFGSAYVDAINGIKNDSQGNLILAGNFQGPTTNIDTLVLTSGNWDTFIVKLDPAGNLVWVKKTSSQGGIYSQVVAVDKFDDILVTGYTMSQWITINNDYITTGTVFGNDQVFTLKFDGDGNNQWSNLFGGSYVERPLGNCIDKNNNFYLTGMFASATVSLCSSSLINTNPGTGNGFVVSDVFFTKFSNPHPIRTDVGIKEYSSEDLNIKLFPNPTTGAVTVFSDMKFDEVIVTNTLGETISEFNYSDIKNGLTIENKGLYFITLKNKQNSVTKKIVVE